MANHRDPRFIIISVVIIVGVFVPLMYFAFNQTILSNEPIEAPTLALSDISTRVTTTSEGPRVFVLGVARNASARDASRIWFRVTVNDGSGRLMDTLLLEDRGMLVPSGKAVPFRLSGLLSISSLDGMRTEVVVERAKVASKWD